MASKKGDVTYEIRADDSLVEKDIEQANKKVEKAAKKSADDIVKVEQDKSKKIADENDKISKDAEETANDIANAFKDAGNEAEKAMSDIEVEDVTVDVDADTEKAEDRIETVSRDKSIDVDVEADTSDAESKIKAVSRDKDVNMDVDADISSARSGIKQLENDLEDAADDAGKAFDNLGDVIRDSLGNAANNLPLMDQVGSLTKGLSGTKAVAIGAGVAAGGALIGIGSSAVGAATDIDSAMNQLQASTGATAEETEKYRQVMENVYKGNYGESFGDIGEAISQVTKNLGDMDNASLQNVTESAFALRDTFGYEIPESTRAAKALMDNFGISGEEAMNLIATGAQNGLDYSGELLDSISEYSPQFEKVGFDADDMFAIFQKGAETGAFSLDKVGDAVKEFSIRAVDGSESTKRGFETIGLNADEMSKKFAAGGDSAKEAFKKTVDALAGIEDPLKQNAAGVDLFGTMWEDLGPEAVTALADIEDSAYETSDAMNEIKDVKYDDLGSQFEELKRNIEILLVPLGERLIPVLSDLMEEVLPPLIDILEPLIDIIGDILEPLMTIVGEILGPLLEILGELLTPFLELIETCLEPLLELIGEFFEPLSELIESCIMPLAEIIADLIDPLIQVIENCLNPMLELFQELFDPIVQLIEEAPTPLLEILEPITKFIESLLVPILWALLTAFQVVFELIVETTLEKIKTVQDILKNLIQFVKNVFTGNWKGAWNNVKNIFNGIIKLFPESIQDVINNIKGVMKSLISFIKNVFSGNWREAWNDLKDIFKGIWDGIASIFKAPLNAIVDGWNSLAGKINGIKVPDFIPKIGGKGVNLPKLPRLKIGMDYVPSDFFPAYLDEGEAVLTKEENRMYRELGGLQGLYALSGLQGREYENMILDIDYERLANILADIMDGTSVDIDGETAGRILTPRISNNTYLNTRRRR